MRRSKSATIVFFLVVWSCLIAISCNKTDADGKNAETTADIAFQGAPKDESAEVFADDAVFMPEHEGDRKRTSRINGVFLNRDFVVLKMNESIALAAVVSLSDLESDEVRRGLGKILWASDAPDIAAVDENGIVTPVSPGTAVITACLESDPLEIGSCVVKVLAAVNSIELDCQSLSLKMGGKEKVVATVSSVPDSPEHRAVRWLVSDMSVVSVSAAGDVIPLSSGTAVITAESIADSSKKASCDVEVLPTIKGIALNSDAITLKTGDCIPLAAAIDSIPNSAEYKYTRWISSDSSIAVVTQSGVVMAASPGTAMVSAVSAVDNSVSSTCSVRVVPRVESFEIVEKDMKIRIGDSARLSVSVNVFPNADEYKGVKWRLSDDSLLAIDENGVVSGLSCGSAAIIAESTADSEFEASCRITVLPKALSVSVKEKEMRIEMGGDRFLEVEVRSNPDAPEHRRVAYRSDNPFVADVDERGRIIPVFPGQTRISAISLVDDGVFDSCLVTVVPSVKSVSLNSDSARLSVGGAMDLKASVSALPEIASYEGVIWSSSDENVATVSAGGKVTAVSLGRAVIIAESTTDPSQSASCEIIVEPVIESVRFSSDIVVSRVGKRIELPTEIVSIPDYGVFKQFVLSSDNETVASIDSMGRVECKSEGVARISAVSKIDPLGKAECIIVVSDSMDYEDNMVCIPKEASDADASIDGSESESFWISKYEITRDVFKRVMGYDPSVFDSDSLSNLPVERVSFAEAIEFCNRLSEMSGLDKCYEIGMDGNPVCDFSASGYRLPSRTEWECAARGGREFEYSGSDDLDDVAWHKGNSQGRTHEVGLKSPNGYGIFDMSGNVSEWCWVKGAAKQGVHIGGGWSMEPAYCSVSESYGLVSNHPRSNIGFRVARTKIQI